MQYYCSEKGNRLRWPTHAGAMAIACWCVGQRNGMHRATHHGAKSGEIWKRKRRMPTVRSKQASMKRCCSILNLRQHTQKRRAKTTQHKFYNTSKEKRTAPVEQSFLNRCKKELLYLGNDSLECFGVIHGQVSENLAVDLDTSLVQKTHQLRIAQTLETSGSIDTLNPQ